MDLIEMVEEHRITARLQRTDNEYLLMIIPAAISIKLNEKIPCYISKLQVKHFVQCVNALPRRLAGKRQAFSFKTIR
jgi:hypothetical protein